MRWKSQARSITWCCSDRNGYSVVTKATKEFVDQTGRRKIKGSMDIELAVDAMEIAGSIDHMVLFRSEWIQCRDQGDEGVRRSDRPAQDQRQHGYRARRGCDGNRRLDRSHGVVQIGMDTVS